jgi:hypothetical protein
MENRMPHGTTDVECPVHRESRQVEFAVNVFRDADHKGLDVEGCSEFLGKQGAVTCGKTCIHTPEARRLHGEEAKKHREELARIGPNIMA